MITKKKLESLKERTRLRKISAILHQAAHSLNNANEDVDYTYINDILPLAGFERVSYEVDKRTLAFKYEDISQKILTKLGAEPSDWDFMTEDGKLDQNHRIIQDKILILDRIRSPYNVGAIFRSADSFGISKIILVEGTASPNHTRAHRTSRGTTETVDWQFLSVEDTIALLKTYEKETILALELGGENINNFNFPKRGVAILGSEEFGISPEILSCAGVRLTIPMGGSKGSLNVSVSAGILMQRWFN